MTNAVRLASIATPGRLPNRAIRASLAVAAVAVSGVSTAGLLATYPRAVDLEIPLAAARRWLEGGAPYLASSFQVTSGAGQPFLYPPFVLPLVAPLTALPHTAVVAGWALVTLAAAVWGCRLLGIPAWWLPAVFLWPPFAQPLLGLNVQILLFAAFVSLFWAVTADWGRPLERDLAHSTRPLVDGVLAVVVLALKTSQVQPWLYLLRRRPFAALAGLVIVAALVLATVPLTGIDQWSAWFAQARHAAQPGAIGGISLVDRLPVPVNFAVVAALAALVFVVPERRAGAWIGLLTIVGSPNLHYFGLLFAIPALIVVRREIGLVAALLIGLYTTDGAWAGIALLVLAMAASLVEPKLLEETSA